MFLFVVMLFEFIKYIWGYTRTWQCPDSACHSETNGGSSFKCISLGDSDRQKSLFQLHWDMHFLKSEPEYWNTEVDKHSAHKQCTSENQFTSFATKLRAIKFTHSLSNYFLTFQGK